MPKMTEALINAELAYALKRIFDATKYKGSGKDLGFRCPECHQAVEVHEEGKDPAHFEHLARNANCRLSDPTRVPKQTG
jgi:hypothetical protein